MSSVREHTGGRHALQAESREIPGNAPAALAALGAPAPTADGRRATASGAGGSAEGRELEAPSAPFLLAQANQGAPDGRDGAAPTGLVTSAITARTSATDAPASPSDLLARIWKPDFPAADLVEHAAALLPRAPRWDGREGPRWHITLAPGAIQVGTTDRARWERTAQRAEEARQKTVDMEVAYADAVTPDGADPVWPPKPPSRREITGWSRKSRANMVKSLCQLDYGPLLDDPSRPLAMLTLTYPGQWLAVAPNGKAAKKHLRAFRARYERAWGESLRAVWKLEFQRRGAPHFHLLIRPPHGTAAMPAARSRRDARVGAGKPFREWVSEVWADVVDHPDPDERARHLAAGTGIDWNDGLRSTDPRRVAVYFSKHGSFAAKEYQHCVPEPWQAPGQGPGRFWGYWGLEKATHGAEVSPDDGVAAGRVLRRWGRSQRVTRQLSVPRTDRRTGEVRYRTVRRRAVRLPANRGFVSVNDGAAFGSQLARWLERRRTPDTRADRRARWAVITDSAPTFTT